MIYRLTKCLWRGHTWGMAYMICDALGRSVGEVWECTCTKQKWIAV